MPSTLRLELELDLREKKKAAIESEIGYKATQHNLSMPMEEGMQCESIAELTMSQLAYDRNRLGAQIAEKRLLQLFEAQGSVPAHETTVSKPVANDFRREIERRFKDALEEGHHFVEVNAGEVHRTVGGYPGHGHRMPICCDVMWNLRTEADEVLESPRKGRGTRLTIRYILPRPSPKT